MHAFRPFLALLVASVALPLAASVYVVNDPGDAGDASPGNDVCATAGGVCTLRAAIQEANAHAGADQIAFAIAGTITPASALPAITGNVIIDATTAPGYAGTPVVVLQTRGLLFGGGSSGSQLAGMKIHGCFIAVTIASANVTLRRNHIGPIGGGVANTQGVQLLNTSAGCVIGGSTDGDGNVLSGNTNGLLIDGSGHSVSDNFIGTDASGTAALPNLFDGVFVFDSATDTVIGGATDATHNVLSGNGVHGISVRGQRNTVAGNRIGTDVTGSAPIPNNVGVGVFSANLTAIGTAAARNVISGNTLIGVHVAGTPPSTNTTLVNNYVGVDAAGGAVIPNGESGIRTEQVETIIGTPVRGNVVSGNLQSGIDVRQSAGRTRIRNNIIGLDATGQIDLGNQASGIAVNGFGGTGAVTIGGVDANEGNTISGNNGFGISSFFCDDCEIYGNTIGLTVDRTTARGNHEGINVGASDNLSIGAPGGGMNVISGNVSVAIFAGSLTGSRIVNNRIGTDGTGMLDRGNGGSGILTVTGSDLEISSNLISGNDVWGLTIDTPGTRVFGNTIGRNVANSAPLPNESGGMVVGADNCIIGSPELGGNVIASNNGIAGVFISSSGTGNVITANSIFGNNAGSFEAGLGIDLDSAGGFGPDPNDPLDPDTGGNQVQNFPAIAAALTTPTTSLISGSLNSTPLTAFALHFYSNSVVDPTGYGEGETYLGTTDVVTDAAGNASFAWSGPAIPPGRFVTATATGPSGTSEFSLAVAAAATPGVRFSSGTYTTAERSGGVTITVTREGDLSGTSTVDYATSNGTATSPADYAHTNGTLTFGPGVASQTFEVVIVADAVDEPTEELHVALSNPAGALITSPATAVVTIEDPRADLFLRKEGSMSGGQATFRIDVVNLGPDTATDVVVTDVLPPGTTLISATPSAGTCSGTATVTCEIPALASGGSATIVLLVSASGPSLSNTATAVAAELDPNPSNNVATAGASLFAVPTVSTWSLIALMSLLAAAAVIRMRI